MGIIQLGVIALTLSNAGMASRSQMAGKASRDGVGKERGREGGREGGRETIG